MAALTEVPGQIPQTFLFHRGDQRQPKERLLPGIDHRVATLVSDWRSAENPMLPTSGVAWPSRNGWWRTESLDGRVLVNRIC